MNTASAQLSNYRQSPRKVGLAADLVRGKRVDAALAALEVLPKRAAQPLGKLIRSAAANARTQGLDENALVISKITVGKGVVLKRRAPKARGSSSIIRKKASHIKIEVSVPEPKSKAKRAGQK